MLNLRRTSWIAAGLLGLCALPQAQTGGSVLTCGGPPKSFPYFGGVAQGTGGSAAEACANAASNLINGAINWAISRCPTCPDGLPFCGGGIVAFVPAYTPSTGPATYSLVTGLWTCTASIPPGSIRVQCNECPDD